MTKTNYGPTNTNGLIWLSNLGHYPICLVNSHDIFVLIGLIIGAVPLSRERPDLPGVSLLRLPQAPLPAVASQDGLLGQGVLL